MDIYQTSCKGTFWEKEVSGIILPVTFGYHHMDPGWMSKPCFNDFEYISPIFTPSARVLFRTSPSFLGYVGCSEGTDEMPSLFAQAQDIDWDHRLQLRDGGFPHNLPAGSVWFIHLLRPQWNYILVWLHFEVERLQKSQGVSKSINTIGTSIQTCTHTAKGQNVGVASSNL